jgi:hypothetical protein
MKKRIRRGLKEGDAGYLERASDADSALEDSSTDSDKSSSDSSDSDGSGSEEEDHRGEEIELVKVLKDLISENGKYTLLSSIIIL